MPSGVDTTTLCSLHVPHTLLPLSLAYFLASQHPSLFNLFIYRREIDTTLTTFDIRCYTILCHRGRACVGSKICSYCGPQFCHQLSMLIVALPPVKLLSSWHCMPQGTVLSTQDAADVAVEILLESLPYLDVGWLLFVVSYIIVIGCHCRSCRTISIDAIMTLFLLLS